MLPLSKTSLSTGCVTTIKNVTVNRLSHRQHAMSPSKYYATVNILRHRQQVASTCYVNKLRSSSQSTNVCVATRQTDAQLTARTLRYVHVVFTSQRPVCRLNVSERNSRRPPPPRPTAFQTLLSPSIPIGNASLSLRVSGAHVSCNKSRHKHLLGGLLKDRLWESVHGLCA